MVTPNDPMLVDDPGNAAPPKGTRRTGGRRCGCEHSLTKRDASHRLPFWSASLGRVAVVYTPCGTGRRHTPPASTPTRLTREPALANCLKVAPRKLFRWTRRLWRPL